MDEPENAAVLFRNVYKYFGVRKSKFPVLNHVNMTVESGTIYGLLGPSGCGKTTSLNCVIGKIKTDQGTLEVLGHPAGSKDSGIPGPNLGYMPQELALFGELTILESMAYFGRLYGMDSETVKERSEELLYQLLDLRDCVKRLIKNLSGGQQRRASFAVSMLHRPCLLILDEPTVGVDPLLRENIWNHLLALSTSGEHTIIITTHYIEEARQANKVGFMRNGRILDEGEPDKIMEKYKLSSLEKVFLQLCHNDNSENFQSNVPQENDVQPTAALEKHAAAAELEDVPLDNSLSELLIKPELKDGYTLCDEMRLKLSRTKGLFIKNLIKMWRNLAFLIFQFFIPSIQIIVFCLAIGGDPKDLTISIVNNDVGVYGANYLTHLNGTIIHPVNASSVSDAIADVRHLKSWGVVHIGRNFSDDLILRFNKPGEANKSVIDGSSINVQLDMTDEQIGYTLQREFLTAFTNFLNATLGSAICAALSSPVKFGEPIFGPKDPTYTEFLAPGVLISIIYFMAVGLTALSFVIERKEGLLDRSYAAGVTAFEVMISHIATQFGVMVIQITLVLVFLMVVFGLTSQGPLVWIIILVILQGMCGMTYGYLISTICDHETSATMLALGSFYPNMLLSGIIWPRQAMPKFLQYISMVLPQTYACESLRCIFSRGLSIDAPCVWEGYLITLAWILGFLLAAAIIGKLRR